MEQNLCYKLFVKMLLTRRWPREVEHNNLNIPRVRVYIGVGVEEIQHICKLYDRSQLQTPIAN